MAHVKQYFPALDGFRLLASLNIVLMHLSTSWCLGDWHALPVIGLILRGPLFNASAFFVLGGFIYYVKLARHRDTFRTWAFLKARFRQLYPLHVLSLCLMIFVVWHRHEFAGDAEYLVKSTLMHLSLLWAFDPNSWHSLNEPSWALTSFFIAYATLGPLLQRLVKEERPAALVACLGLALLPSVAVCFIYLDVSAYPAAYEQFHVLPFERVFEFYFGMVIARLFEVQARKPIHARKAWERDLLLLLGLGCCYELIHVHWDHGYFLAWFGHHTLSLVAYGWMVWNLAFGQGVIARLLGNPVISTIGRASFYPYLLHLPLIALTIILVQATGIRDGLFDERWHALLFIVLLYGLSVVHVRRKGRNGQSKTFTQENGMMSSPENLARSPQ